MSDTYTIRYRQPGQWWWRRLKNVKEIGFIYATTRLIPDPTQQNGELPRRFLPINEWPLSRWFHLADGSFRYCSKDAEVEVPPERKAIVAQQMSREIGQPVQVA